MGQPKGEAMVNTSRARRGGRHQQLGARVLWAGVVLLLGLCLTPLVAQAQTTAVLGVGGSGGPETRTEIADALLNAATNNPDLNVLDRRDLDVAEALMLLGCSEINTQCLDDLAATLEVDRVLYAAVYDQGSWLEVEVRYFDAAADANLLAESYQYSTPTEREELQMRLAAVVSNQVVLRIQSERESVRVSIDGAPAAVTPVILTELSPGQHSAEATCDGCEPMTRTLTLERGRFYTEVMTPADAVVAQPEPPVVDDGGGSGKIVPIVVIVAGGALIATGVAFGFVTQSTQDEFNATPSRTEAEQLADDGETQALLTNVFLGGGIAVAALGVILLVTSDGDTDQPAPQASRWPEAAPWVGPDGAGVALGWTF
jgi:hypothetical protein